MIHFLTRAWWRYSPNEQVSYSHVYHWFNVAEGLAWCAIAVLVARRYQKHHKSPLELVYAAAFVSFGATDFVESQALTTWLILGKGANLLALFALRRHILRRHYPESKTF